MIWVKGKLVEESALSVPISDRVFEHGLGLFETFRTWGGGRPTLMDRHLERMKRSANDLGLPFDPTELPDASAVSALLETTEDQDAAFRITMTGGRPPDLNATIWMNLVPMPPPTPPEGAVIGFGALRVDESDPLWRYKTLNYWSRRMAHERARASGNDERLAFSSDGRAWEGTRTNLFIVRKNALWTPTLTGPILPGVMREMVLQRAVRTGIDVQVVELNLSTIEHAEEIFLTNSVRGVVPVGKAFGRSLEAPGPVTRRIRQDILDWLEGKEGRR